MTWITLPERTIDVLARAALSALMILCGPCLAKGEDITLAGRHTVYWAPKGDDAVRQPLLLFSHGYGGCATQSSFLMQALATDGFWVFAPDHDDARCAGAHADDGAFSLRQFFEPETWNDTNYIDRRDNLVDLLNTLRQDARFSGRIDFSRIGLLGHSLGGYTVLGLAGAWPSWRMPGVKAVLALSPYSQPFNIRHTIADVRVPVMFQGGTRDFGITPAIGKGAGSYEQANPPKYFVEFRGAGHFAWTDLNRRYAASIAAYSVAFFERYLKGSSRNGDLVRPRDDVSRLSYESELGASAAADPAQDMAQSRAYPLR
jgi:predicted dienelactone hydrolase